MKKIIVPLVLSLIALLSISMYQLAQFNDGKLHVVFCDVGQGDSILIKTPSGSSIIIDGGPDSSIINCLGHHLPFWQRNISAIILTHPHADHLQGLLYVLDRYSLDYFITEDLKNKTFGYTELMRKVKEKQIPLKLVIGSDNFVSGNVRFDFIGPTKNFLNTTSPTGMIGENKEFASLETLVSYGKFKALFTGDSQAAELTDSLGNVGSQYVEPLSILQIPHHGSASGLDEQVLSILQPTMAVITVGKHNLYHHPNPFTLSLLKQAGVPYKRTDDSGDVEVVSDGKAYFLK